MAPAVLWQNDDRSVAIIDIPTSIAAAQINRDEPYDRHLLSSPPLQTPFTTNEPKSTPAKAKLESNAGDANLHAGYQLVLQSALQDVKGSYDSEWCRPRPFTESSGVPGKRKANDALDDPAALDPQTSLPHELLSYLARGGIEHYHACLQTGLEPVSEEEQAALSSGDVCTRFYMNQTDRQQLLRVTTTGSSTTHDFHVLPRASFYIGDCADSRAFHAAVRSQAQDAGTRRDFDFMLLDPPWPNRSVKRTHKTAGSTYSTSTTLADIRELILDMKLDLLISDNSLVGMWVTNKPAVRELVLSEDGIFECWNIELFEEWIWLKTTVHGEPVTPLDALWRKPYEVLLLGRRRKPGVQSDHEPLQARNVKRRVIIGVPDLHSRKPCLKQLIEPLMPDPEDYRALEVFARHLVAGWWSWGDECIKYNWGGFWRHHDCNIS